jgi:ketosteroid isomerase-like protein
MSEENVELVRRGYEAYARGDLEAVLGDFSPDLVTFRSDPDGATFHGREGFLEAVSEWVEDFEEFDFTPLEFTDAGNDCVLVHLRQRAVGAQSGAPIEGEFWFVHTIRDGAVVRLDMFIEERQARQAAGLGGEETRE